MTPVLKSGKYIADFREMPSSGGAIELSAGDDFVGYETSYYRVSPAAQSGVSVEFMSSTVTIEGKKSQKQQPIVRLFQMPAAVRHVRLVFLTRVSRADHNQAILAAAELDELDRLTKLVEADPATNCRSKTTAIASGCPKGSQFAPKKPTLRIEGTGFQLLRCFRSPPGHWYGIISLHEGFEPVNAT